MVTNLVHTRDTLVDVVQAVEEREAVIYKISHASEHTIQQHVVWLSVVDQVCLQAIKKWRKLMPWAGLFIYRGQDYEDRLLTDSKQRRSFNHNENRPWDPAWVRAEQARQAAHMAQAAAHLVIQHTKQQAVRVGQDESRFMYT